MEWKGAISFASEWRESKGVYLISIRDKEVSAAWRTYWMNIIEAISNGDFRRRTKSRRWWMDEVLMANDGLRLLEVWVCVDDAFPYESMSNDKDNYKEKVRTNDCNARDFYRWMTFFKLQVKAGCRGSQPECTSEWRVSMESGDSEAVVEQVRVLHSIEINIDFLKQVEDERTSKEWMRNRSLKATVQVILLRLSHV